MTRFPSPLTTAMLLLLLSVAATTAAETGPFSVETEDGHDVLAPFAPVPIEPEPASRSLASCTNTEKKKFKVTDENGKPLTGKKNCKGWAKLKKCDSLVNNKKFTVASVCKKSCVTNTITKKFQVKGPLKKKCDYWAKNDHCTSKKNGEPVFTVCEKSCNHCGEAPSAAPTTTWQPSATFTPTATWAPSATFAPTDTHPPSNTKEPSTTPPN